jgi:hypothetical protein
MVEAQVSVSIGVVAHQDRLIDAWDLAHVTCASFLSVDNGDLGVSGNHSKVWHYLAAEPSDWSVVLEDDAIVCDGFLEQLNMVLAVAPSDIVGLYLGTSYPPAWQQFIEHVQPDPSHWAMAVNLIHGVGTCVRSRLVPDMCKWIDGFSSDYPVDAAISEWARAHGIQIGYTRPSLVNHKDGPTLIDPTKRTVDTEVRDKPRRAWQFGTRDDWSTSTVNLTQ